MTYHEKVQPRSPYRCRYGMEDPSALAQYRFDLPDLAANEEAVGDIVKNAKSLVEDDGCDVILPMRIVNVRYS